LHRIDPGRWPLTVAARHWASHGMTSIIRGLVEARGVNADSLGRGDLAALGLGLARPERVRGDGYLATSDFTSALLQVVRATLTAGYQAAPRTWVDWCQRTTLPDFRVMNRVSLGLGPAFVKVPEHGEYQRGGLDAHVESLQLGTWGRVVAVTRQAIVNDDLGVFSRLPTQFGFASAALESDLVYGILTSNPTMSDGNALFSTAHKNLAAPAGIDLNAMTAARQLMAGQTSTDGTFLRLQPMFLICGPSMETQALQFTSASVVPTQPSAVIPQYFKALQVVVDPRITDNSWYLSASPNQIGTIEVARLAGTPEEPEVLAQVAWEIDAHEFKGRIDRAVGAIDWRGLVKTPSA
jgi:phage major head subunit gpT-like protein